jgi:hypothetical protein
VRLPVCVLALVLVACGSEPTAEERRERFVDDLAADLVEVSGGALGDDAARCVAGRLADDVGVDRFDDVVDAARGEDDPELRNQVIDAFAACDALEPLLDG